MLLIELMCWLLIRRDSARSRKVLAPAERVGAVVALNFLSWSGPH